MLADRWGVSEEEVAREYPCDEFVPAPKLELWRGVTVQAPPERVWPWVAQIQLAPYSYDWLDNRGRRSPQSLLPRPVPAPGEHFTTAATGRCGRMLAVTPGQQLTGRIMGAVMSYVLVPDGDGTRLLLKIVARGGGPLLSLGDLVMARRQLLNFKRLAEAGSHGAAPTATGVNS
jgi:hypothetical protein